MPPDPFSGLTLLSHAEIVARARSLAGRQAQKMVHEITTFATEAEWRQLAADLAGTATGRALAESLAVYFRGRPSAANRLGRRQISDFAALYRAPEDGAGRDLAVVLTGLQHLVGIPTAAFLSHLDARRCDVLYLADPGRIDYRLGVPGLGASLVDLAGAVAALRGEGGYRRLMVLGSSKGAFPALRLGRLVGADSAVAFGGRWSNDPVLALQRKALPPAFDPLCACCANRPPRGLAFHGDGHAADTAAAILAETAAAVLRVPVPGLAEHNVVHHLWRIGILGPVLRDALERPDRVPSSTARRARLGLLLTRLRRRASGLRNRLLGASER